MKEIIIKELSFSYSDKEIFHNLDLDIEEGAFITLMGASGSGKTTFALLLLGLLPHKGYININRTVLEKGSESILYKKMAYISEQFYDEFIGETVLDELVYTLENMGYSKKEIKKSLDKVVSLFHLDSELELSFYQLSESKKAVVKLASALIIRPKILILDNLLAYMDTNDKKRMIHILQKENKENKMLILNITVNEEDLLLGKQVLLFKDGKIKLNCKKEEIYNHEKEFDESRVKFPFMTELSKKLSYYNLLSKETLNMEEMVGELWK